MNEDESKPSVATPPEDGCCPICFLPSQDLVLTKPCSHSACLSCFERILLSTNPTRDNPTDNVDENDEETENKIMSHCPSRGRCPLCRTFINLFDLTHTTLEEKQQLLPPQQQGANDNYDKIIDKKSVYNPIVNMKNTPLNDLSFASAEDVRFGNKKRISFHEGIPEMCIVVDKEIKRNQYFESGFYYHDKSNTFSGIVDWTKSEEGPFEGSDKWDVIIQFSSDFRYIQRGAIIKYPTKIDDSINISHQYPMDGKWRVQWMLSQNHTSRENDRTYNNEELYPSVEMTVALNNFDVYGISYKLCIGNDDTSNRNTSIYFDWPGFGYRKENIRQVAESGVDLKNCPEGPDIGAVVTWTVNYPRYHRIIWTRLSKDISIPKKRLECLGRTGRMFYCEVNRTSTQSSTLTYNSNSPWGNSFIQANIVGLASYHFISPTGEGENGVYISYEHERCSSWPSLDDGSPVPHRVPFINHSYDAETRTFRGIIPWMAAYGTTWQGNSEWVYEMVFDTSFICIVSGSVHMENEVINFGETLNYCNAAIVEIIKAEVMNKHQSYENEDMTLNETTPLSNHVNEATNSENDNNNALESNDDNESQHESHDGFNDNHDNMTRSSSIPTTEWIQKVRKTIAELKTRLGDEGASIRTLNLVSHACNGAIHPDIIDYNLGPTVSGRNSNNFNVM